MSIELNANQNWALNQIKAFLNHHSAQVFILKGSAGTGKTTLVRKLVEDIMEKYLKGLDEDDRIDFHILPEHQRPNPIQLLATTGRAAKILRDKTDQEVKTLHSTIYKLNKVADVDHAGGDAWDENNETGQLYLDFVVAETNTSSPSIYLVDEASMINAYDVEEIGTAKYGSGNLMRDFLQLARGSKIIFVGDFFQLPPVGKTVHSAALDTDFLKSHFKVVAMAAELTKVQRQAEGSEVLRLATTIRNWLEESRLQKFPVLPMPQGSEVHLLADARQMVEKFVNFFNKEGPSSSIMISMSNDDVLKLNREARRLIHGHEECFPGDLLMVVQNSYTTGLVNGDQVVVEKIYNKVNHVGLTFLDVELRSIHNDRVIRTLLMDKLLHNNQPGISNVDYRKLMLDFDTRMKNLNIKRNSDAFKDKLFKDEYMNAVRAKFGYAITTHKAQGGEWENVFMYVSKSLYSLNYDAEGKHTLEHSSGLHRWLYTAITRSSGHLWINDGFWIEGYNQRSGSVPYKDVREGRAQLTVKGFAEMTAKQGKKFQYIIGKLTYEDGQTVSLSADGNRLIKPFQVTRIGQYRVRISRNAKQFPQAEVIR